MWFFVNLNGYHKLIFTIFFLLSLFYSLFLPLSHSLSLTYSLTHTLTISVSLLLSVSLPPSVSLLLSNFLTLTLFPSLSMCLNVSSIHHFQFFFLLFSSFQILFSNSSFPNGLYHLQKHKVSSIGLILRRAIFWIIALGHHFS